jgi:hypothetical protein
VSTPRGLLGDSLVVRCYDQDGTLQRDFDFAGFAVAPEIRSGLAVAFARRTAAGAGLTSMISMSQLFVTVRLFAGYLAGLAEPVVRMSELGPSHIDGFYDKRFGESKYMAWAETGMVKKLLLAADGLSEAMLAKLRTAHPPRARRGLTKTSYSRAEFKRIAEAARADLRAAAIRIRGNRELLRRYRAGEIADGPDRRLELLDYAERHCDLPHHPGGATVSSNWVTRHGTKADIVCWTHLSALEAIAGVVLLTVMTGQNSTVVLDLSAPHHRADGHTGRSATAIVPTRKPRRGQRAHMDLSLSEVPDWISVPRNPDQLSARDELHTPFGVYALLLELTSRSREITGSDRLFLSYHNGGKRRSTDQNRLRVARPASFLPIWAQNHNLIADMHGPDGQPEPLRVQMSLLRLTYVELHQKPVAHTETTLVNDYLARNRGNLAEYRQVVADALAAEVDKARARGAMTQLTAADVVRAGTDPDAVAAEHGVDAATLKRMIGGDLDTVIAACSDNENSPHAPAGQSCRASFMQCLDCPCARALPRHLPIQVLVHDQLQARKAGMTPLEWVRRFALPHAQLADLLARHDSIDIDDARASASDDDRAMVERFLHRELDIR